MRKGFSVTINGYGRTIRCAGTNPLFYSAGRLTIRNAIITDCGASPLSTYLKTPIRIENSIFRGNGGPIIASDSEIVFDNVLFEDNTNVYQSFYAASVMDIRLSADVTFRDSIVRNNVDDDATLYVRSSTLETAAVTIEGCSTFENNSPLDISDTHTPSVVVNSATGPCVDIVLTPWAPPQPPVEEPSDEEIQITWTDVCEAPAHVRRIPMGVFACLFIHGDGADARMEVYGIDPVTSAGFHMLTVTQAQVDAHAGEAAVAVSPDGRALVLRWADANVTVKGGPNQEGKILHVTLGGGLSGPVLEVLSTYGDAPGLPYLNPPSASSPARAIAPGCMVTTNYILNLREQPGGEVLIHTPYNVTLTVLGRAPGWWQVDYHGLTGWLSADYTTPNAACA